MWPVIKYFHHKITFLGIHPLMSLCQCFFSFLSSSLLLPTIYRFSIYESYSVSRCIKESGSPILDSLINI